MSENTNPGLPVISEKVSVSLSLVLVLFSLSIGGVATASVAIHRIGELERWKTKQEDQSVELPLLKAEMASFRAEMATFRSETKEQLSDMARTMRRVGPTPSRVER